jgi:UV DNA damage repair endonuclease
MLGKDLSNTLFYQAHNHLRYKLMKIVSLWGPLEIVEKKLTQFPYVCLSLSLSLTSQKKTAQDNQFYKLIKSDSPPTPQQCQS